MSGLTIKFEFSDKEVENILKEKAKEALRGSVVNPENCNFSVVFNHSVGQRGDVSFKGVVISLITKDKKSSYFSTQCDSGYFER